MSLAVVTCFFNFAGFKRPQANLHRFLRQMARDGVPVYGVELSFDGRFLTHNEPHWQHFVPDPARQSVWQKEASINVAARALPPDITSVAWIDADVWFANPNWVSDTEKAVERHDIVQLFDTCHWTSESGTLEKSIASAGRRPLSQDWKSHPGFAWAMRRSLWDKAGGLYPFVLSGGGDALMAAAFQNSPIWDHLWRHAGKDREPFLRWARNFKGVSVGHVPGALYHEWHGSIKDRDYYGRAERLVSFEVSRHLEYDKRGLLRWTAEAPAAIIKTAAEYFPSRREDGK